MDSNTILAFIIEWGTLLISILLVFSPFIYLGIRKWKRHLSVNLGYIIAGYILSFLIFLFIFYIAHRVDRWVYNNHSDYMWLMNSVGEALSHSILFDPLLWVLLVFYCNKLLRNRFTILNSFASAIIASLLAWGFVELFIYTAGIVLGYIGRNYF